MHPMLEEFCRSHPGSIRPEVFRRWQRISRDEIAPKLDAYDRLVAENAELRAKVERFEAERRARKGKGAAE